MQVGIDSFAAAYSDSSRAVAPSDRLRDLVEQIEHADQVGLDVFGIGEHHLKVGVHALGYVVPTTQEAADEFLPGYASAVTDVGKERGWPPVTRAGFDAQRGPEGALLIGSPNEVVEKILRHSEALGGISRLTFQLNVASLPQEKLMQAIDLIGARVAPALREGVIA